MCFFKKLQAGRGAVFTANDAEHIKKSMLSLYSQFLKVNNLHEKSIVSIHFSVTPDLTAVNPATVLRNGGYAKNIPLFCCVEPTITGSHPFVIRIICYYYSRKKAIPVYVGGAESLRPDLTRLS